MAARTIFTADNSGSSQNPGEDIWEDKEGFLVSGTRILFEAGGSVAHACSHRRAALSRQVSMAAEGADKNS